MKLSLLPFAAVWLWCGAGLAQMPDAELVRLREKFDGEVKVLHGRRDAGIKAQRERYIVVLNEAEGSARSLKQQAAVDAIESERKCFETMKFPAAVPGLPGRIMQTRAIFLAALAQAQKQIEPGLDALNGRYLRELTALEESARQAGNSALQTLAAAEKAKLLGVPAPAPARPAEVAPMKPAEAKPVVVPVEPEGPASVLANGGFTFQDPGDPARTAVWRYRDEGAVSYVTEFGNSFLRMDSSGGRTGGFFQKAKLPGKVRSLKITLRARVGALGFEREEGKITGRPAFFGWAQDADGRNLAGFIIHLDRQSKGWDSFEAALELPEGAAWLACTGEMMKTRGVVDIDDVRAVPAENGGR